MADVFFDNILSTGYTLDYNDWGTYGTYWGDYDMYIAMSKSVHMGTICWSGQNITINGSPCTSFADMQVTSAALRLRWEVASGQTGGWRIGLQSDGTFGKPSADNSIGTGSACRFRGANASWTINNINTGSTGNQGLAEWNITSLVQNSTVNPSNNVYLGINYYTGGNAAKNPAGTYIGTYGCRFKRRSSASGGRLAVNYIPNIATVKFTSPASTSSTSFSPNGSSLSVQWAINSDVDNVFSGNYSYTLNGSDWTTTTGTSYLLTHPNPGSAVDQTFTIRAQSTNPTDGISIWGPSLTLTLHWPANRVPNSATINYPSATDKITYNTKPYFKATASDPDGDVVDINFAIQDLSNSSAWVVSDAGWTAAPSSSREWQCTTALTADHHYRLWSYVRDPGGLTAENQYRDFYVRPASAVTAGNSITKTNMDNLKTYISNLNGYYGLSSTPTAVTQNAQAKATDWNTYATGANNTPHVSGLSAPTAGTKINASYYNSYIDKIKNG